MQNRANFDDFNISEADAKKFIGLGIKGELQFEVMNNQQSRYQLLNDRQLNEIRSNHPEKKDIRLTDGHYNQQTHNYDRYSYEQSINYEDLWFDASKFEMILKKYPHYSEQTIDHKNIQIDELQKSPYFNRITMLLCQAIQQFPDWSKKHKKIQKTGNLLTWVQEIIGAKTDREADFIIKVMSDFFKEIN